MRLPERNVARAQRIDKAAKAYRDYLKDDDPEPLNPWILAGMLADMRHWCDLHDADFDHAVDLSRNHWENEQGEDGE